MVATEQRKILSDQAFLKDAQTYYTRILRIALRYLADCLRSGCASVQAVEGGLSFPSVIGFANTPGCPAELRLDRWDAATCLKIAEFLDTITQDTGESKVLNLVIGNRKWFAKPVQAVVYAVRSLFEMQRVIWKNPALSFNHATIDDIATALHNLPVKLDEYCSQIETAADNRTRCAYVRLAAFRALEEAYQQ